MKSDFKSDFISVTGLSLAVNRNQIIDEITFVIAKGEATAIVGANGSGKSTILRLLTNILTPNKGELRIDGLSYRNPQQALQIKSRIGFAADNPPLYTNDTVYSYLKFMAQLKNIPKQEMPQRIANSLEIFALNQVRNKQIYRLSKGTQQRVNLSQAILNNPELLILDEPSNGLDTTQCANLVNYLQELKKQQVTIIVASHNYTEIVPVCDYMFKLNGGKLEKILLPVNTIQEATLHDKIHTPA